MQRRFKHCVLSGVLIVCTGFQKLDVSSTGASYSCNKSNEMHQFLKFIFGIEFYMFPTGLLSIIRSLVLYTQQ
jgi:hypothetical protein